MSSWYEIGNTGKIPEMIKDPWQVTLDVEGKGPIAVKVRLFDLLYRDEANGSVSLRKSENDFDGFTLPHDIIVFNSNLYSENKVLLSASELWVKEGFDIAPVRYDKRAAASIETMNGKTYTVYPPEAALYPTSIDYFNLLEEDDKTKPWYNEIPEDEENLGINWAFIPLLSASIDKDDLNTPFILSHEDTSFKSLLTSKQGYSCFNTIGLNPLNKDTWKAVSYLLSNDKKNWKWQEKENEDWESDDLRREMYPPEALKLTYIWLKCSFYGDYIKAKSFNQDLHQKSQPVYKNFSVSSKDDVHKFDNYYSPVLRKEVEGSTDEDPNDIKEGRNEKSLPYIPLTTPLIDILSDKIIDNYYATTTKIGDLKKTLMEKISVPIPSINRISADANSNYEYLTPPGWLDPERRSLTDYDTPGTKKPLLLPKEGNAYIDGRILSITIDEIWIFLKRLMVGRLPDEEDGKVNDQRSNSNYMGSYFGWSAETSTTKDTTLAGLLRRDDFEYAALGKKGDILSFNYTGNINEEKLTVTDFVSEAPFVFNLLDLLKSTTVNLAGQPVLNDYEADQNAAPKNAFPYSLRELELLIKTISFNLISYGKYIQDKIALNGKTYFDNDQGSLFQFHKDYKGLNSTKNTYNTPNSRVFPSIEDELEIINDESLKKITLPVHAYGTGAKISRAKLRLADIYLAADGTWRHKHDYLSIPVLEEEF